MKNNKESIVKITEVPSWMVRNKYLHTGYKKNFNSFKKNLASLFIQHNELLNIWTHLIGAIIFLSMLIYLARFGKSSNFTVPLLNKNMEKIIKNSNLVFQNFQKESNLQIKKSLEIMSLNKKGFLFDNYLEDLNLIKKKYLTQINEIKNKIENKEIRVLNLINQKFNNSIQQFEHLNFLFKNKYFEIMNFTNGMPNIKENWDLILKKFDYGIIDKIIMDYMYIYSESSLEIYPFLIYYASVIFCLLCSTIYHWFFPISETIYKLLHKLDLAGISILIFGSNFAVQFYYFYCMPNLLIFYSSFMFFFCSVVFICIMQGTINKKENVIKRTIMFVGLGLSSTAPVVHLVVLSFYSHVENDYLELGTCIYYLLAMASCYLIGALLYGLRIPERFYPQVFDIWFNSHTIWHVCVFSGAFLHHFALVSAYSLRLNKACLI